MGNLSGNVFLCFCPIFCEVFILEKIKKESYGFLTIFVACIMMVLQRILISAVTIPTYATNPGRFYIYTFYKLPLLLVQI